MSASETGIRKRSLTITGHRTSVSLEAPFWQALARMAASRGMSVQALVAEIDRARAGSNLSSAIRVYLLREIMAEAAPRGEER